MPRSKLRRKGSGMKRASSYRKAVGSSDTLLPETKGASSFICTISEQKEVPSTSAPQDLPVSGKA